MKEYREYLRIQLDATDATWVAQLNGAWSHRGWKARHHSFLVRAKNEDKVVSAVVLTKKHVAMVRGHGGVQAEQVVHEGNYFGTSKGMEGEAAIKAFEELKEANLLARLTHVAADGDSGVPKLIANTPGCEHVEVAGDPGHQQKNFMRSLKEVFGAAQAYKGFPYRIGKFYMRCLKRAEHKFEGHSNEIVEQRHEYFMTLWTHALPHYTRKECPASCPCNEFYQEKAVDELQEDDIHVGDALEGLLDLENGNGDADDGVNDGEDDQVVREVLRDDLGDKEPEDGVKVRWSAKRWLDAENPKEQTLINKITPLMELAGDSATDVLFGLNTCLSECSNSRRLVFLRKDRFYYRSYEARSLISAVTENIGRAALYVKLFQRFGMEMDDKDDKVLDVYGKSDKVKVKRSERKKSLPFKRRQAVISKSRIEENIDAALASKERRDVRGYTKTGSKKLKSSAFARRRGSRSQADLEKMYEKGLGAVHKCDKCGWFYTKSHTACRKTSSKRSHSRSNTSNHPLRKRSKGGGKNGKKSERALADLESLPDEFEDEDILEDDFDVEDEEVEEVAAAQHAKRRRGASSSRGRTSDQQPRDERPRRAKRSKNSYAAIIAAAKGDDDDEDDFVDVEDDDDDEWEQLDPDLAHTIALMDRGHAEGRRGYVPGGEAGGCSLDFTQFFLSLAG